MTIEEMLSKYKGYDIALADGWKDLTKDINNYLDREAYAYSVISYKLLIWL